jgi:hypothetical protein
MSNTDGLRRIPRYSYTQFTWTGPNGSAAASDLGIPAGAEPGALVWHDAADVGFVIQGESSDKLFTLALEDDDCWTFVSEDNKHRVVIWND